MKKYLTLFLSLLALSASAQPITSIDDLRPVPGDQANWTLQKLLHGWLNTKFTVGAKDVIATNTVTITSLTTPTAGYVVATNAIPFFSAAGGKGMLQYVMLCAHTNAALTMHVFRNYPGTATPGSAYDYDVLNKGHLRVCPPLDFSTWTALGTGGASGESFCSAIYGLNIPVTSVDGNLHIIIVAGSSPKAQAGWNSTGTAPIHQILGGIEDPQ